MSEKMYIDKFGIEMDRDEWQVLAADDRYCLVASDASADGRMTVTAKWKGYEDKTFRIVVRRDGKHVYSETVFELAHTVSAHARIAKKYLPVVSEGAS